MVDEVEMEVSDLCLSSELVHSRVQRDFLELQAVNRFFDYIVTFIIRSRHTKH